MTHSVDRRTRTVLAAAATLASVLALAACGSGATPPAGAATAPAQGSAQGGAGGGQGQFGGGRGFPGTSGLVADVTGNTAQVQSTQSQTAVTWTKSTKFTAQTATTASSLRVGDCVSARPARPAGTAGSTPTSTPSASSAGGTTVAAATVEIFPATNGTCETTGLAGGGGFGGPGGAGPGGGGFGNGSGAPQPTARPQGSGAPTGGANGFGAQFRGATGKVAAVDGGSFTVQPIARRDQNGTTSAATSPVTVTYAASTTFTTAGKASASAVKVGVCLTAFGKADDTGAVTATTIQLSQPVDGSCTTGFRLGGGGGRPGATPTGTPNA
ncbi:hypothetical protein GCM10027053_41770 [Intrasporangium mesophilum]